MCVYSSLDIYMTRVLTLGTSAASLPLIMSTGFRDKKYKENQARHHKIVA